MKSPTVPTIVVASVICLTLGAVGGYYARHFAEPKEKTGSGTPPPGATSGMGGMMGGMMGGAPGGGPPGGSAGGPPGGGGMGGMGGMMGGMGGMGGPPPASAELKRLIRSLNTVQRVQDKGLSAAQVAELLPLFKALQSAEKISDDECKAKTADIMKILAEEQKTTLQEVFPQGAGFGGFGGMGGMGGGKGGPPGGGKGGAPGGGGMPGMGGGMGGQKADPDKPFASERDKKSLADLIATLEAKN